METILITCFYVGITAMFASLIMVPVLRRWALEKGQVDEPDQRKMHTVAIPRIGGIAIFMAFLFSHLVYVDICLLYTSPSPRDRTRSRMPSSA